MTVYRLCKAEYAGNLSGEGARKFGGRWNSKGIAMVYTAESRALATTELAVHLPLGIMPKGYVMVNIEIPEFVRISELEIKKLPVNWKSFPYSSSTQEIGDAFIREQLAAVLKAPSAVVPGDFNYLLNPAHNEFMYIRVIETEPYGFDERLFMK